MRQGAGDVDVLEGDPVDRWLPQDQRLLGPDDMEPADDDVRRVRVERIAMVEGVARLRRWYERRRLGDGPSRFTIGFACACALAC